MRRAFFVGTLVVAIGALVLGACGTDQGNGEEGTGDGGAPVLRFTAIPDQTSTELEEKFVPFADHLAAELGVPVEYVAARDYQASVEMFKNGDVDLAWFGGLTGVQARRAVPGALAIAQGASDPTYVSYFIAHRDTGLEPGDQFPSGIADLRFTFGSPSSTSGRLMPEYFIRRETGRSPQEFFAETPGFSGSHDKTAELVESGRYQAGVLNYKVYERRVEEGTTDPDVARVIWETPPYADYNWTVHPQVVRFGDDFVDRLQGVLVGIDDPVLLAALPRQRLIEASNEDYAWIEEVAEQLDMLR